ncbi:MAG TPA: hypothetical protein VGJ09_11230, partial [Bryobacteraceae bacterium]
SLAIASLWVLIPAVCAAMIVEINAPQIRFLAGAIGREDYLLQAGNTYASLAWLRDHTAPAERILGLENCSDVYAPPFPRYQSYCAFRPWMAPEVATRLQTQKFDWLLAPAPDQPAVIAGVRAAGRMAVEMYRDPAFVIYRLE